MGWEALRRKQQLDFLVPYDEMTCWRQLLWAGYDKNTKVGCTRSFSLFSKRLWSTPFALKFLIGVFPLEVKWKPEISPSALSTPSFIFFSHSFQSSSLSTFNYPKFCIGFKIRKSRSEQLLLSGSGHSKWFSSAALQGVMWDWVEQ